MCLQHYFSYSFCSYLSPIILLPCSTSHSPPTLCPRLKRIRTAFSNEFCPKCLLTSHTQQLHLAPHYTSYKPKAGIHSYCAAEAAEACAILSRAERYFSSVLEIQHIFAGVKKSERLAPKVANVVAYLYYLLLNHFWSSLQRKYIPGAAQRMLLLGLRGLIENEIRNEKTFVHFPPCRKEYIHQSLVVPVDMRIEDFYPICEISRMKYGEACEGWEADYPVRIKSCGHVYGGRALAEWLLDRGETCPKDRSVILPAFKSTSEFQRWMEQKRVQDTMEEPTPESLKILIVLLGKEVEDMPHGMLLEEFPIDRCDFVQEARKISVRMEMEDIFWLRESRVLVDSCDYYGQGGKERDCRVQIEQYRQGDWVSWPIFVSLHPNCS